MSKEANERMIAEAAYFAAYEAGRMAEARASQPDWEKLWAEVTERAEKLEAALRAIAALRPEAVFATSHKTCDLADAALEGEPP